MALGQYASDNKIRRLTSCSFSFNFATSHVSLSDTIPDATSDDASNGTWVSEEFWKNKSCNNVISSKHGREDKVGESSALCSSWYRGYDYDSDQGVAND